MAPTDVYVTCVYRHKAIPKPPRVEVEEMYLKFVPASLYFFNRLFKKKKKVYVLERNSANCFAGIRLFLALLDNSYGITVLTYVLLVSYNEKTQPFCVNTVSLRKTSGSRFMSAEGK